MILTGQDTDRLVSTQPLLDVCYLRFYQLGGRDLAADRPAAIADLIIFVLFGRPPAQVAGPVARPVIVQVSGMHRPTTAQKNPS